MSDMITNPENATESAERDDAITATASPRPWRVNGHSIEANDPEGLWLQNEKTGWGVVANLPSCPKSRMSKKNRETWDAIVEANAALIVAAVNKHGMPIVELVKACDALEAERDRLRDLVRRLAESLDTAITNFGPLVATYRVSPPDPEPLHDTLCGVDITELLREAREAMGKGDK